MAPQGQSKESAASDLELAAQLPEVRSNAAQIGPHRLLTVYCNI